MSREKRLSRKASRILHCLAPLDQRSYVESRRIRSIRIQRLLPFDRYPIAELHEIRNITIMKYVSYTQTERKNIYPRHTIRPIQGNRRMVQYQMLHFAVQCAGKQSRDRRIFISVSGDRSDLILFPEPSPGRRIIPNPFAQQRPAEPEAGAARIMVIPMVRIAVFGSCFPGGKQIEQQKAILLIK